MSVEETNIDDLFDNMELETDETAAEEAALLDIFAKDPSISSVTDDDDASDKGEDGKKTTPDTSTIIPDSEEDFVMKLSPNKTKTEGERYTFFPQLANSTKTEVVRYTFRPQPAKRN